METIDGAPVVVNDDRQRMAEVQAFLRRHHSQHADALMLATADGQQYSLPPSLIDALDTLTALLAQGDDVALVPMQKELTPDDAASLLNVSPQFVIKLLEEGAIPSIRDGAQRRVRARDLFAYRQQRSERNKRLLDDIAVFAQEHGGYD